MFKSIHCSAHSHSSETNNRTETDRLSKLALYKAIVNNDYINEMNRSFRTYNELHITDNLINNTKNKAAVLDIISHYSDIFTYGNKAALESFTDESQKLKKECFDKVMGVMERMIGAEDLGGAIIAIATSAATNYSKIKLNEYAAKNMIIALPFQTIIETIGEFRNIIPLYTMLSTIKIPKSPEEYTYFLKVVLSNSNLFASLMINVAQKRKLFFIKTNDIVVTNEFNIDWYELQDYPSNLGYTPLSVKNLIEKFKEAVEKYSPYIEKIEELVKKFAYENANINNENLLPSQRDVVFTAYVNLINLSTALLKSLVDTISYIDAQLNLIVSCFADKTEPAA